VASSEEQFTPLHFCARYLPRVAEKVLSEAEEQTQRVNKRSSSWRAISYLINLRGDNKVDVWLPRMYAYTEQYGFQINSIAPQVVI